MRFPSSCLLLLVPLTTLVVAAQTPPPALSPLPRLLAERQVLTSRYAAASAQRHSLFGNKPSKKDLQEVVDALQGIVDQDERIVAELHRTAETAQSVAQTAQTAAQHYGTAATTLENTSRDDRNLTAQRVAELQNDLANAQQRERKFAEQERALQDDLQETRQGRVWRDGILAVLGLSCAGLLWRRKSKTTRR